MSQRNCKILVSKPDVKVPLVLKEVYYDRIDTTDQLVQQERELLIEILRHLREIERRRLFSALGFKSLFDYAVKRLKYSEDQAGRRISKN